MSKSSEIFQARVIYFCGSALIWTGAAAAFYGVFLFGWQCLIWLDKGTWLELPAILLFVAKPSTTTYAQFPILEIIPEFTWEWLYAPNHGLGLYKIVMWILNTFDVGFVAVMTGIVSFATGTIAESSQAETIRIAEKEAGEKAAKQYRIDHGLD